MKPRLITGALRTAALICHLACALPLAVVYSALGPGAQRAITRYWSHVLLRILGVRLSLGGAPPGHGAGGALLVANHISWLDVFLINAAIPSTFIAKSEVRSWPLVGWLCQRARTLFIERGKRADALLASRSMARRMAAGECIVLFPEGTTTTGAEVGPFHASLLQSAIEAGCAVHPVAIRYQDRSGRRSEGAAYVDDMTLVESLRNVLFGAPLHATIVFLPGQSSAGRDRRTLAEEARTAIRAALHGTAVDTAQAAQIPSRAAHRIEA